MGRLHTRYSPVRRSPPKYCYFVLPLDLHVLGLPLAFILSQDQTLRCIKLLICSDLFQGYNVLVSYALCLLSKNISQISSQSLSIAGAKVWTFFDSYKIFLKVFSIFFAIDYIPDNYFRRKITFYPSVIFTILSILRLRADASMMSL